MNPVADVATETIDPVPARGPNRGLLALALALLPALAAIAFVPEFSTQDGPAHLFNARILASSLRADSSYSGTYEVNWRPVPNWAGHAATVLAVELLPAGVAGRAITAGTLAALAGAIVWLRWRVAGADGLAWASVLAVLLGLNVTWLLGFTSFLLGATLFPITLASWWRGRDQPGPAGAARLAGLLILGYFCHPVSLGMTAFGLAVLTLATPGPRRGRLIWTLAALVPLVPLGLIYAAITRSGGGLEPTWQHLAGRLASPRAWVAQLSWVDPLSLAAKTIRPLGGASSPWYGLLAPAAWTSVGLILLAGATWRARRSELRGWGILAALILAGGVFGPDTLGERHGHYLPQRLTLLGLVALVPWLDFGSKRPAGRLAVLLLGVALAVQSAFVWEYALDCRDRLREFLRAGPSIGTGQRVGTLLVGTRGRFLANPLLHADCLFGIDPPNIIWGNYETDHYYFPVRVRADRPHPAAKDFEVVSFKDGPGEAEERLRLWESLLREHHGEIDVLVTWQADRRLDAITERWFQPRAGSGRVRTWAHRGLHRE
ncbi:hypothetical protein TA3x_002541 [Tundrisphaera sp. TA3]|uniref:hypothetical protein n=1 Tax=Tundrisphaera sp. TA3 TaxID=3435775 RepID=UPI003EC09451